MLIPYLIRSQRLFFFVDCLIEPCEYSSSKRGQETSWENIMSKSALYTFTAANPINGTKVLLHFTNGNVAYDARRMAEDAGYSVDCILHPTKLYKDAESAMDDLHDMCA